MTLRSTAAAQELFPRLDADDLETIRRIVADVAWVSHGGSGFAGIGWREAWDLEWDELLWLQEEAARRRNEEAKAIRAASKK